MVRIQTRKISKEDSVSNSWSLRSRENKTTRGRPQASAEIWAVSTDLGADCSGCKWYREPGAGPAKGANRSNPKESRLQIRARTLVQKGNALRMRNPREGKWGGWLWALNMEAATGCQCHLDGRSHIQTRHRNICFQLFPAPTHWWEHSPLRPCQPSSSAAQRAGQALPAGADFQCSSTAPHPNPKPLGSKCFGDQNFQMLKGMQQTVCISKRNYDEWIKPITKAYIMYDSIYCLNDSHRDGEGISGCQGLGRRAVREVVVAVTG